MSLPVVVPRAMGARKPPHGAPCNRCGLCCVASLCPLGAAVFQRKLGPCPALQMTDGESSCGLVANPGRFSPIRTAAVGVEAMRDGALALIGSDTGCDARINGETPDRSFYERLRIWDKLNRARVARGRKAWGA